MQPVTQEELPNPQHEHDGYCAAGKSPLTEATATASLGWARKFEPKQVGVCASVVLYRVAAIAKCSAVVLSKLGTDEVGR